MYEKGDYTLLTKEEYIDITVRQLELLPPETVIERITGDGDKTKLIAPLWSTDKISVLGGIDKAQAEQLKMMLSNYEDMEISFSSDMFGLFDEEMTQKILSKLIKQLKEQLGEDAYEYAAEVVRTQMQERVAKDPEGLIYWGINDGDDEMDGFEFQGVNADTPFYINNDGNVVISYNKYDAGPGYMGIQEFEIPAR